MFSNARRNWTKTAMFVAVFLCLCGFANAQNAPEEQRTTVSESGFKISGTVVNALTGAPLSQTRIALTDTTDQANTLSVLTAEDGRFAFTSLKSGKFSLFGARRGFVRELYQQHQRFSTAIVTGPGLGTENLVMRLTPLAFLSGTVFDETGEAVRQANVMLYAESHRTGAHRVEPFNSDATDDQGYYEFSALPPGNYFVSVTAKPWYAVHGISSAAREGNSPTGVPSYLDVAYPTTYNNGATDSQAASPIPVHGGDRLQVDVHLNPVPVLHLIFRAPADPQRGLSTPAFQKPAFDSFESPVVDGMQQISPGVFEITGVPAGKYTVQMRNPQTGQLEQGADLTLTRDGQELDVSQSQPSATVNFLVEMPHHAPRPKELYLGLQDPRGQVNGFFPVDATGHVTFESVQAGKYLIVAYAADKRYSVTRAFAAGVELSTTEFTVTPGSSADATIYLTGGVVTVEGFVKRGSKPASGVMVTLVPKDPQIHGDMFRRDQSDSDGSFALRGVIPGNYTLVAVEDAWDFAWNQPETLNRYVQRGQNFIVGELMSNTVHLPEAVQVQPR
jgi:Carboxypeptidase regulatory-like domain